MTVPAGSNGAGAPTVTVTVAVTGTVPVRYVGLATRAVAMVLDAALINVVAILVELGGALIVSILHLPSDVKNALLVAGAVAYALWSIGYFVWFWTATGQTPGARVMQFRVVPKEGGRLKPRRALVRAVGLVLAALPLMAGYLIIPFDERRRGFQDRFARTLVVEAPQLSIAEQRRVRTRAQAAEQRTIAELPGPPAERPSPAAIVERRP